MTLSPGQDLRRAWKRSPYMPPGTDAETCKLRSSRITNQTAQKRTQTDTLPSRRAALPHSRALACAPPLRRRAAQCAPGVVASKKSRISSIGPEFCSCTARICCHSVHSHTGCWALPEGVEKRLLRQCGWPQTLSKLTKRSCAVRHRQTLPCLNKAGITGADTPIGRAGRVLCRDSCVKQIVCCTVIPRMPNFCLDTWRTRAAHRTGCACEAINNTQLRVNPAGACGAAAAHRPGWQTQPRCTRVQGGPCTRGMPAGLARWPPARNAPCQTPCAQRLHSVHVPAFQTLSSQGAAAVGKKCGSHCHP